MKKLYKKGTVHPSPPLISDHLSFLPATILSLTVALSPQDREVLAYLISCSSSSTNSSANHRKTTTTTAAAESTTSRGSASDHPACFSCYCFRCYMSYWVRWDSSPNRQLIHEIIDAYEDGLSLQNKKEKSKKERRRNNKVATGPGQDGATNSYQLNIPGGDKEFTDPGTSAAEIVVVDGAGDDDDAASAEEEDEAELDDKGSVSVRRFVSFLGQRIWGSWT